MIWTIKNHFGPIEGQGINLSKIKISQPIVFVKLCREHRQSVISDSTTASCITEVRGPSVNIESGVGSKQGNLLRGIVNCSGAA